ncbi:DUF4942 domain-containing protein [Diaphorobacter sp. LR2014-1]|uniref:DUF4942 domain-containing protein n=1 Tax=Diaphorobacter sp. LR2014-1 TaxID=1933219 RepID=UPI000CDB669D|nr:DUF4942 domain-containing protein [Diaphorobacter sp. LR2014-1]
MSYEYFPTGAHTALKMAMKFKRPLGHICDPSAGKGHLLRHLDNGFEDISDDEFEPYIGQIMGERDDDRRFRHHARNKWWLRSVEKSAVEIDVSHHADLRALGCKIVGFNFMDVESLATVSHVIMNPPFSKGAEHVLHAWDCLYDAELVAIVNAQTIKNPFSVERRRLVDLIAKHGNVEFYQDEFVDHVERKTTVEIALIYLEKKPTGLDKLLDFMDGLKQGDNEHDIEKISPEICQAVAIPENFIQNTIHNFKDAVHAARIASEAIAIASRKSNGLGISLQEMQAKGVGNDFRNVSSESVLEEARKDFEKRYRELKNKAWAQIIRSSLLTDKLSNQARRKVEAQAEQIYQLEFTLSNVYGFLKGVVMNMGDIYNDMICGLFDNIMNRSNDNVVFYKSWKSNAKHKKLGMRVKRTRFILPRFTCSYLSGLSYEGEQFLSDVDKVFGYLDGVTDRYDGLVSAFKTQKVENGKRYSTRYFDFRFYFAAGTIHFYPKNMEVIERLNRFVGKIRNWIPSDWEEANQDFKKQYDEGEKLQDSYQKEFRKSSFSRYSNVAYAMLSDQASDRSMELEAFSGAVEAAQEAAGIFPGPALGYEKQTQLMLEAA